MKDETERLRLDAEREQAATAQRAAAEAEEAEEAEATLAPAWRVALPSRPTRSRRC